MNTALFIISIFSLLFPSYIWWKHRRYIREYFAFALLHTLAWFTLFVVVSLSINSIFYSIFLLLFLFIASKISLAMYRRWPGKKSVLQHQREQTEQTITLSVLFEESILHLRS